MASKIISLDRLKDFLDKLKETFVAQEAGKGLSTNDYTTPEKTKLQGIAEGAQVNVIEGIKVNGEAVTDEDSDKVLDITIPTKVSELQNDSNFISATDGKAQDAAHADTADKLTTPVNINGVAFDGSQSITVADNTKIPTTEKGVANGVATLDSTGKVPAAQLPSYVDDVIMVANEAALDKPSGEEGKIYVTEDTGKVYRFVPGEPDGEGQYIEINSSVGNADHAVTADSATTATRLNPGATINNVQFDGSTAIEVHVLDSDIATQEEVFALFAGEGN